MTETPFEGYPLRWPEGTGRTPPWRRGRARFDMTFAAKWFDGQVEVHRVRGELVRELGRMGARYIVITSNLPIRRDGLPYAGEREPDDPGAAVYFEFKEKSHCFACDRWDKVGDNLRAISKTVEALRGIERWGSTSMVERAFSGFEALPPRGGTTASETMRNWREILGSCVSVDSARAAYKALVREAHPDTGGSHERMVELNQAIEEAEMELE